MKKLIVILALLASSAHASNWIKVATSTEGTVAYIDTKSVTRGQTPEYRHVWMKYQTNVETNLVYYQLYCPTRLALQFHYTTYIRDVLTSSYPGQYYWFSPIPDSIEATSVNVACLLSAK